MKIKRLFFDIETSPNVGVFWSAGYKQQISYDNIVTERAIVCICYKWEGESKVHSLTWSQDKCDKEMLKKFARVLHEADEVVGHNVDRYDLPWVRSRCILHGIQLSPNIKTIDTLKVAKSKFRFNSNRLDYLAKFLGVGRKIKTEFLWWKDIVLFNDQEALTKMERYCKGDVKVLENVFLRLRTYFPAKVHHGMMAGKHRISCPDCGSNHMAISKTRISAAGHKVRQLQCRSCGKYHSVPETFFNKHHDEIKSSR